MEREDIVERKEIWENGGGGLEKGEGEREGGGGKGWGKKCSEKGGKGKP